MVFVPKRGRAERPLWQWHKLERPAHSGTRSGCEIEEIRDERPNDRTATGAKRPAFPDVSRDQGACKTLLRFDVAYGPAALGPGQLCPGDCACQSAGCLRT